MGEVFEDISEELKGFEAVSLKDMDAVKLMNRIDTKYVFGVHLLPSILEEAKEHYKVLEIEETRGQEYYTTYFDTENFEMYTRHHNGLLNRYKIRHRKYVLSNNSFMEIKFKSNKGKTFKKRINDKYNPQINSASRDFIGKNSPFEAPSLIPQISNSFTRITLVHKSVPERVTLDFKLGFELQGTKNRIDLPQISIAEVKRESGTLNSDIISILRNYKIQPTGMSKYCIGLALTHKKLKKNTFKKRILYINKIKQEFNGTKYA